MGQAQALEAGPQPGAALSLAPGLVQHPWVRAHAARAGPGPCKRPVSYRAAFKTCGLSNMWMANAFKRMGGQCF